MEPFNELDLKKYYLQTFLVVTSNHCFLKLDNAFRRISYKIVCFMVRDDATLQSKVRFS